MELSLLILVGGCSGLIGLAAGFWICDSDNKELKKAAAAAVREVEERARAQLNAKESASALRIRELEEEIHQLMARLAALQESNRAARRHSFDSESGFAVHDGREAV